jgi:hypothetical protein
VIAVGDRAADWLAVADVPVGAQHASRARLGFDAARELLDRAVVVVADDLHVRFRRQ